MYDKQRKQTWCDICGKEIPKSEGMYCILGRTSEHHCIPCHESEIEEEEEESEIKAEVSE